MKDRPTLVSMPEEIYLYNGNNERCDTMNGPCVCGAWHSRNEIFTKVNSLFGVTLDEFDALCLE